jgi:Ca2+-binding EF-hand superfamily protein
VHIANLVKDEDRENFDRLDEDGDGSITFEEFSRLMLEMDHTREKTQLRASFNAIDTNRDGRVSFEEFCAWVTR